MYAKVTRSELGLVREWIGQKGGEKVGFFLQTKNGGCFWTNVMIDLEASCNGGKNVSLGRDFISQR